MKTLLKSIIMFVFCLAVYSNASSQDDTTKRSTAEQVKDKTEDLSESEEEIDHNHSALKEDVDEMKEILADIEFTGDFDIDYAKLMIQFHETGIDLGRAEIMRGNNDKLKSIVKETNEWLSDEIEELKDFVKDYDASGKKHEVSLLRDAAQKRLEELHNMKITGNIDKDFVNMMIKYHNQAIDFHKMQIDHGMSADLKQRAENSIKEQEKVIAELKQMQNVM